MTILVTGGTGSLGHALASYYHQHVTLRIYSRDEEKLRRMAQRFPMHTYVIGDVRDRDALRRAVRGTDAIIHAAALKQVPTGERQPLEVIDTNVGGARNVMAVADGRRVVAISTDKAVEPVNAYGASKMLADYVVLDGGGAVCRYGNVLGSTGSIVPVFSAAFLAGEPLPITDPDMTRFVMTMPEAVALIVDALESQLVDVFVRSCEAATVRTFAHAIAGEDHPWRILGPRPGEKTHEKLAPGLTSDSVRQLTVDELRRLILKYQTP